MLLAAASSLLGPPPGTSLGTSQILFDPYQMCKTILFWFLLAAASSLLDPLPGTSLGTTQNFFGLNQGIYLTSPGRLPHVEKLHEPVTFLMQRIDVFHCCPKFLSCILLDIRLLGQHLFRVSFCAHFVT